VVTAQIEQGQDPPVWPRRDAEHAAVTLLDESRAVELVELSPSSHARVYALHQVGQQDLLAVLHAPGFVTRLTRPDLAPQGTRVPGEGPRHLVVASSDIRVTQPLPEDDAAKDDDRTAAIIEFAHAFALGVRLRLAFVAGAPLASTRGICVIAPGLAGWTPAERHLMEITHRGWTVVGLMPDPVRPHRTLRRSWSLIKGSTIGAKVDGKLADDAFVVDAVLRQLVREEPSLATRPLVLVGGSLGALGVPATALMIREARETDPGAFPPVRAAVLVGCGAGLGEIATSSAVGRSLLALAGIDFKSSDLSTLRLALDAQCAFAPERCLGALDGARVLLIDGSFDAIVPRRSADHLWSLLGEPERWSFPVGHIGLFLLIGRDQWDKAVDWIEQAAETPGCGPAPE
jgi:hypothetical protein